MDDLLNEFLTETNESIAVLDVELVELEQNPDSPDLLANIFRLVHTIKGTCGFLGLPRLEKVAHAGENVLGKVRDGELKADQETVTLILESLDRIKELVGILETTEAEPEGDDSDLVDRLNAMAEIHATQGGGAGVHDEDTAVDIDFDAIETEPEPMEPVIAATEELEEAVPDEAATDEGEAAAEAAGPASPAPKGNGSAASLEIEDAGEAYAGAGDAPAALADPSPEAPAAAPGEAKPEAAMAGDSAIARQTIRVQVDALENLMNMVSELVLTRNQLLQMVRGLTDSDFLVPLQRLSHVTSDLQEGVMQTRMQPIGNAWSKLPRIVRDLAKELDKKIDLQMKGADTELDRQVLELIKDPLTHMVRNSGDHGIESRGARLQAGKPETGKILLNAFHEGGHIIIQVSDDGQGLPVEKIKEKAIANGLVTQAEVEAMSEQRILQLIFRPGLSTAEKVTSVSGRGVGMDVVRSNIEKIGGAVEVASRESKGTQFTIKIPLTLAIVSALIVECSGERFAIPQIGVVELVGVKSDSDNQIEAINDAPVLRLRNRLLPLVYLRDILGMKAEETAEGAPPKDVFIIVSQVGANTFGIVVDKVFDTEEIVVKPVAPMLRDISTYSGNTILGDGSVIMILDPNGIAASVGERALAAKAASDEAVVESVDHAKKTALLVFRAGGDAPRAVPLSLVARLEEIDVAQVERSNGMNVVQYRGKLMPLIPVEESFEMKAEGRQPILVFADRERTMGLLVDEIVDIVEDVLDVEIGAVHEGVMGSAVVAGMATEILDTTSYLTRAFADWFGSEESKGVGKGMRRVLLVDDSSFFRDLIGPLLATAGYDVTTADDADAALEMREAGEDFDVIVSDIEMPGMSGFDFAQAVREDSRWRDTPMVALSSHTSPSDMDRGRDAGFVDYVAKMDRQALLHSLSQTLDTPATGVAA